MHRIFLVALKILQPFIRKMFSKLPVTPIVELTARIFADYKPNVLAVYVFQQTVENQDSGILAAVRMIKSFRVKTIAIIDGETDHGATGFTHCERRVYDMGIESKCVTSIYMDKKIGVNTLSEAEHVVRYAKKERWSKIYITSTPFHMLRIFITMVSVAVREYPELKIYSLVGETQNWNENVRHSQGVLVGKRKDMIAMELAAIARYTKKGDLLPVEKVLEYLNDRDK